MSQEPGSSVDHVVEEHQPGSNRRRVWLRRLLELPLTDLLDGLDGCIERRGVAALGLAVAGLAVGWWIYVPIHELFHAWGCLAAGGTVDRLEISPLYGGMILESWIPWVVAGGEYAGRLAGFDTGGSDLVYLVTDFAPYLLTLFPGVWALRRAGRRGNGFVFGAAMPFALAPFVALPGDAYEIGSIAVTRMPPWSALAGTLRGDDVIRVAEQLSEGAAGALAWCGFGSAVLLGVVWAFATYRLGGVIAEHWESRPGGSKGKTRGPATG